MARQFIYHMQGLTKAYSGGKKVLENIHLSFYPGRQDRRARAERLGQVDAAAGSWPGIDKEFTGEAWLAEGATVGYLPQEPQLDAVQGRASATSWRASPRRRRSSTATTS